MRRFEKLLWHQQDLKDALDTAKREAAASQEEAANSRQFTAGLLGNVWRVIHEESPERWAAIFGKMYADHYKGVIHSTRSHMCLHETFFLHTRV